MAQSRAGAGASRLGTLLLLVFMTARVSHTVSAAEAPSAAGPEPVSFADVQALGPTLAEVATEAYGAAPEQTIKRYPPITATPSRGASVLIIHGGCWSNAFDRDHALPTVAALNAAGFDVWLPEYRRVGDPGGGWPGTFDDIRAAIAYAHEQGDAPLWLIGHSAGGHLALWAASDSTQPVAGVIALAAITDVTRYGDQQGSCQKMVPQLLGGPPSAHPDRYRTADIRPTALSVPYRLLWGDQDPIVGEDQLLGFPNERIERIPGAGHFDLIHPHTPAFARVLQTLEQQTVAHEP